MLPDLSSGRSERASSQNERLRLWIAGRARDLTALRAARCSRVGDDSGEHGSAVPRRDRARVLRWPSPSKMKRAQGMPDAGRTREPCVQRKVHFAHASNTGQPEQPAFPARWFTAYTWSPRSAGLVSLRRSRERLARSLTPASGCQDHAISPSASAELARSVNTSIASRATCRDDRDTPL